ncbi:J domain-containing protein [Pseudoscourfieldia marina]
MASPPPPSPSPSASASPSSSSLPPASPLPSPDGALVGVGVGGRRTAARLHEGGAAAAAAAAMYPFSMPNCVGRYLVTKCSWRGKYKRLLCITTSAIVTLDPTSLEITNKYNFVGDGDFEAARIDGVMETWSGRGGGTEGDFILSVRQSRTAKFKAIRFVTACRAALLTDLYTCLSQARAQGSLARHVKPLPDAAVAQSAVRALELTFTAARNVVLSITPVGVKVDGADGTTTGEIIPFMALELRAGALLLADPTPAPSPQHVAPLAMCLGPSQPRRYRLFAFGDATRRLAFVEAAARVSTAAVGRALAYDARPNETVESMLTAESAPERPAGDVVADNTPLGEWRATRQQHDDQHQRQHLSACRLILTPTSLVERDAETFALRAAWRLSEVRAIVRNATEVQMLAIVMNDPSAPIGVYLLARRDDLVAAMVDAVEAARTRSWSAYAAGSSSVPPPPTARVAVMPAVPLAGDRIHGARPAPGPVGACTFPSWANSDPEVERLLIGHLADCGGLAAAAAADSKSRAGAKGAAAALRRCVAVCNASMPFGGVSPRCHVDEAAPAALLALLPTPSNLDAAPRPEEASYDADVLACLHRLSTVVSVASLLCGTPGALSRVFGCVRSADAGIAYASARLLSLLFLGKRHGDGSAMGIGAAIGANVAVARAGLAAGLDAARRAATNVAHGNHGSSGDAAAEGGNASSSTNTNDGMNATPSAKPGKRMAAAFSDAMGLGGGGKQHIQIDDEPGSARYAKANALSNIQRCGVLVSPLRHVPKTSALVSLAVVEAVCLVVCEPGSATTDSATFSLLLMECASLGRPLFLLFDHPASRVTEGVSLLMRAIAECGVGAASVMRDAALREGAVLHHLLESVRSCAEHRLSSNSASRSLPTLEATVASSMGTDPRNAKHTETSEEAVARRRALSRELVALWCDGHVDAVALMERVFPQGLLAHLKKPRESARNKGNASNNSISQRASTIANSTSGGSNNDAHSTSSVKTIMARGQGNAEAGGERNAVDPATVSNLAASFPPPPTSSETAPSSEAPAPAAAAQVPSPAEGHEESSAADGRNAPSSQGKESDDGSGESPRAARRDLPVSMQLAHAAPNPESVVVRGNWAAFWSALATDHALPTLVWDERCRRDVIEALANEEERLRLARSQFGGDTEAGYPSWNHTAFAVVYPSLAHEPVVGGINLRLLLEPAQTGTAAGSGTRRSYVMALDDPLGLVRSLLTDLLTLADGDLYFHTNVRLVARDASRSRWPPISSASDARRVQVVNALSLVYRIRCGEIGPLPKVTEHIVRLFDVTFHAPLRAALLSLLESLCINKTNASAAIAVGAADMLVATVMISHEAAHRVLSASRGGVVGAAAVAAGAPALASGAHKEPVREWFCELDDNDDGGAAASDSKRSGPHRKEELLRMLRDGKIGLHTRCFAQGMLRSQPLFEIRELRWLCASTEHTSAPTEAAESVNSGGSGCLSSAATLEMAVASLRILHKMLADHPGADSDGRPFLPPPLIRTQLWREDLLAGIVQGVLTNHSGIVAGCCSLVLALCDGAAVEKLSRLYRTGLFFFVLMYTGSDLLECAKLLAATHTRQSPCGTPGGKPDGADGTSDIPSTTGLRGRSALGDALPESLLYVLHARGAESFARALVGDSDTPELLWTTAMRARTLLPAISAHVGELPERLRESTFVRFDYLPLPPIHYSELDGEVWCHRYYLRALTDTSRFPDWVIDEPVDLLQSVLELWRKESSKKVETFDIRSSLGSLDLLATLEDRLRQEQPDVTNVSDAALLSAVDAEILKRAYRTIARKHHPDKNPADGGERFMRAQRAYEQLMHRCTTERGDASVSEASAATRRALGLGADVARVQLVIATQVILYSRSSEVLAPFRYAGYSMVMTTLKALASDPEFFESGALELTHQLCKLLFLTCTSSAKNGIALVIESADAEARSQVADDSGGGGGGARAPESVRVLADVFTRCASRITTSIAVEEEDEQDQEMASSGGEETSNAGAAKSSSAPDPSLEGATSYLLKTFAGLSALNETYHALALVPRVVAEAVRLCLPPTRRIVAEASLQCLGSFGTRPELAALSSRLGAVYVCIHRALLFDVTAEGVATDDSTVVGGAGVVAANNHLAMLAVRALGRLNGSLPGSLATAACPQAAGVLAALLPSALFSRLSDVDPRPLLRLLNATTPAFTTELVWSARFRDELARHVASQFVALRESGGPTSDAPAEELLSFSDSVLGKSHGFAYDAASELLFVAGYCVDAFVANSGSQAIPGLTVVRAMPSAGSEGGSKSRERAASSSGGASAPALSAAVNVLQFAEALRRFLQHRRASDESQRRTLLALVALERLIGLRPEVSSLFESNRGGVEPLPQMLRTFGPCIGAGSARALLALTAHAPVAATLGRDTQVALSLFRQLLKPQRRAAADGDRDEECAMAARSDSLALLHALGNADAVAWVAAQMGGALILLRVSLEQGEVPVPLQHASLRLLGRLMHQPAHGSRVVACVSRLLPPGFTGVLADGDGAASLAAFDQPSRTPERVWSEKAKLALIASLKERAEEADVKLGEAGAAGVELPAVPVLNDVVVDPADGPLLGGIYVRLFLSDPGYPLRNAGHVLESLSGALGAAFESGDVDTSVLLSAAVVALLRHHAAASAAAGACGIAERALGAAHALHEGGGDAFNAAMRVVHALARHVPDVVGGAFAPRVGGLAALTQRTSKGGGRWAFFACIEALTGCLRGARRRTEAIAAEAEACGLIDTLVGLLPASGAVVVAGDGGDGGGGELPRGTEVALAVQLLEALSVAEMGTPCLRIRSRLDGLESWNHATGQDHSLFLPSGGGGGGGETASVLSLLGESARLALPPPPKQTATTNEGGEEGAPPPPPTTTTTPGE